MNARTPFNPAAHDFFVAAGYVVTHDHYVIVTEGGATYLETEEGRQEEAPSLAVLS